MLGNTSIVLLVLVWLGAACGDSDSEPQPQGDGDADGAVTEDGSTDESTGDAATSACSGSTKAELCTEFCEAVCAGQDLYCLGSACEPGDCNPDGNVFLSCSAGCEDEDCARERCESVEDLRCEAFGLERDGVFESYCLNLDPNCQLAPEVGCSDVCGSAEQVGGDLADNGVCEDGREGSVSGACARGTDCTDCGPYVCAEPGGTCTNHGDCCGFLTEPGALCTDADGAQGSEAPACFSGCDAEHPCPTGFRCAPTSGARDVCVPSE